MNQLWTRWVAILGWAALCVSTAWGQQPAKPGPVSMAETASTISAPATVREEPGKPERLPAKYDVSKIGNRGIGDGLDFYSFEKEQALGKQLAAQVEHNARLVTDPEVLAYVNRIGQNIVRNSDAKVPFTIKVIDDDTVNAFALPGGFFYVDSGLILAADNEAELAGVMAHEIAHVAARHATKQATRSELLNWASVPLIFIGGPVGYAVRSAVALAVPLSYLKFSRGAEKEADLLGLEYMYASGYDPQAFVQFFEKLEAREKEHQGFLAKAFATHPMNGDRVKAAQKEIQQYLPERPEYVVDTSDFDEVKARLMVVTDSSRMIMKDGEPRPVLRRRESVEKGDPDHAGEARPTLKQRPNPGSTPDITTTDEERPTLKRAPSQ